MKAKSKKKEKKPIEQEVERYLANLMDDDGALRQIVEEEIRYKTGGEGGNNDTSPKGWHHDAMD
jgi:hypothetical protein